MSDDWKNAFVSGSSANALTEALRRIEPAKPDHHMAMLAMVDALIEMHNAVDAIQRDVANRQKSLPSLIDAPLPGDAHLAQVRRLLKLTLEFMGVKR